MARKQTPNRVVAESNVSELKFYGEKGFRCTLSARESLTGTKTAKNKNGLALGCSRIRLQPWLVADSKWEETCWVQLACELEGPSFL
jgi:hypothetical protein